jgi:hypothetical protein
LSEVDHGRSAWLLIARGRLLAVCRYRRFTPMLFPLDPRMPRMLAVLRVDDALAAGASQREIATALFGEARVRDDWAGRSDALRSRVRRLVREARALAAGVIAWPVPDPIRRLPSRLN